MPEDLIQACAAFLMASSLTVLIFLFVTRPVNRLDTRLRRLSGKEKAPDAVGQHAGRHVAVYEYNRDLYEEQTIRGLHEHFNTLLRSLGEIRHAAFRRYR